ncbi:MAG: hypothetical protein ABJO36_02315 [Litorimonas sp.]
MMKRLVILTLGIGVAACSDPAPKTGVMPGIATGGYDVPSNAEASAAFMAAFQARYDIPELDYPEDIKLRIRQARADRLQRDMRVMEKRQKIMAKLALTVLAKKDPEAKKLLEDIKNDPKASENPASMEWMASLMEAQPKRYQMSESQRQKIYQSAVTDYKTSFRNLEIETCRWTEMKRLIGSGHEEMAYIHGDHPTHGFKCSGEMRTERRKGYPRLTSFSDFWVKSSSGDWLYYGQFRNVGIAPRNQYLNQNLLNNPEETIARQNSWDMITSQLQ